MTNKILRASIGMVLIVTAVFCLTFSASAQSVKDEKSVKLDRKQPIQVTSDLLEAFNDKRLVVFSGHAVAIQGDKIIRADKLMIFYKKAADAGKPKEVKGVEGAGDLDRIEAVGHVSVTQGNRVATGDMAVYDQDTERIIMTGGAVMREGKNVVRGNKITLLIKENRGVVEAEDKKRVTATIYPSEKKETGKQKESGK
ncbi:MAG: Lipopolysaccharide export system protein LptA [Syntrophus sp. SKADARSKE-3]|nr:Lipopolysaccharide export system protein LptA [Syntrophus sp. SKADARSKE-3]